MAGNIDEVIADLEGIVADCLDRSDRAGYFAAMYLAVTRQIKAAVDGGKFEAGPRMAALDQIFAQRYIDAFRTNQAGGAPSRAWTVSFLGATKRRRIIVQQLLAGMNAHINLDLGIAAATVAPGDQLDSLLVDFNTINTVLASMTKRFTTEVGRVSPWIGLLNRIGGKAEQEIIRFSIDVARHESWKLASQLAPLPQGQWQPVIDRRDRSTADLGHAILSPGVLLSAGLWVIRLRESNNVAEVMTELGRLGPE
jgi:hypothetical protein